MWKHWNPGTLLLKRQNGVALVKNSPQVPLGGTHLDTTHPSNSTPSMTGGHRECGFHNTLQGSQKHHSAHQLVNGSIKCISSTVE